MWDIGEEKMAKNNFFTSCSSDEYYTDEKHGIMVISLHEKTESFKILPLPKDHGDMLVIVKNGVVIVHALNESNPGTSIYWADEGEFARGIINSVCITGLNIYTRPKCVIPYGKNLAYFIEDFEEWKFFSPQALEQTYSITNNAENFQYAIEINERIYLFYIDHPNIVFLDPFTKKQRCCTIYVKISRINNIINRNKWK